MPAGHGPLPAPWIDNEHDEEEDDMVIGEREAAPRATFPDFAQGALEPITAPPAAVILAAGAGSRLRQHEDDPPKPLTELLGLTLVERAILSCREVGVREFVVVVGYRSDEMIPFITEIEETHGVRISTVENARWELGNGTSVLASEPLVDGPFFLLMGDHIFDPDFLRRLIDGDDGRAVSLVVDHDHETIHDVLEATKVRLRGDDITAIGKRLNHFDAVDTGVFLCRPPLFRALRRAQLAGDYSLSAAVRLVARDGEATTVEAGGLFWQDVDTPEDLGLARNSLLDMLGKEEDGYITRFVNRRLSRRLSERLVRHADATRITLMRGAISTVAAVLFARGTTGSDRLAGALAQLVSIIDGCDGEVARLTFRRRRFSRLLDTVIHRYAEAAMAAGIMAGSARRGRREPAIGAIAAVTGYLMTSYTRKHSLSRVGERPADGLVQHLAKRDLRLAILALGAMAGRPYAGLVAGGVLGHLSVLAQLLEGARERAPATE